MSRKVLLHPDVIKYLDSLEEKERARCYASLKRLEEDPITSRPGCDIKKLHGKRGPIYRLRVGEHRLIYLLSGQEALVQDAFRRGRGY